jgi:hypothetical protein
MDFDLKTWALASVDDLLLFVHDIVILYYHELTRKTILHSRLIIWVVHAHMYSFPYYFCSASKPRMIKKKLSCVRLQMPTLFPLSKKG